MEEAEEVRENKYKWAIKGAIGITLLAILTTIVLTIFKVALYQPFKVTDINIEPDSACPGDEIQVTYELEVLGGPYTIDRIQGSTYWIGADGDPRPLGSNHFNNWINDDPDDTFFVYDKEAEYVPGPTRRSAPFIPTDFYAAVDATLYGRVFGIMPVSQDIVLTSDDYVTIRERNDPECVNKYGGQYE